MKPLVTSSSATQVTRADEPVPNVRKIIHVDMDAFYASVEQRDDPDLQGRPVIVGGRPNGRGVVAACSYEARAFGIHSAMPSAEAGRRCPSAAFVRPRFEVYKQVSTQIHAVFREFSTLVEPLSLDEAYLDVTTAPLLDGSAVRMAREIKQRILETTGLVASAGVSYNKFLAKIASDMDKPDGLYWILPADGAAFVAELPIGRFHGIGKATEARMQALGIHSGADLCRWSLAELTEEFGKSATYYHNAARGIDDRPVRASRTRKSMGSETTFSVNLIDTEEMLAVLERLTDELMAGLQDKGIQASTLTVKVRFADFTSVTRAHSEAGGIRSVQAAHRVLPFLLQKALMQPATPSVRLLGVSFSGLGNVGDDSPEQLELPI